ncbi:uncharacterized protein LOC124146980 [Haliotis rufescens]|uniref:uncharacterized protein LOC124146980 n=1 Tax=Haliotis rufescens TaxID=6454 RepID=UPI00201F8966|nr:uncharacterized protein LOC124146980 [Haliotis rufescens]
MSSPVKAKFHLRPCNSRETDPKGYHSNHLPKCSRMASPSAKRKSDSFKKVRKNCRKKMTMKKRTFTCHKCKAHFRIETYLVKHMKECPGSQQEMVICHLCGKGFPDRAGIEKHLRAHTKSPCCFCTMCNKTFAEFEDLEAHINVCKVLRLRRKEMRKAFIRKHQIFKRLEQIEIMSEHETSNQIIVSPDKTVDIAGGYAGVVIKEKENVDMNSTVSMNNQHLDENNTVSMNYQHLDDNSTVSMNYQHLDENNTVSMNHQHLDDNNTNSMNYQHLDDDNTISMNINELNENSTVSMNDHQLDKNSIGMNGQQFDEKNTISMIDKQLDENSTIGMNDKQSDEDIINMNDKQSDEDIINMNDHQLDEMDLKSHDNLDADLDFLCENCGLQFERCSSLIEHYQVHKAPKLASEDDHRHVEEFDYSLFFGDEELKEVSEMKSGPRLYVDDIMDLMNERFDVPTGGRNSMSSETGLFHEGNSGQDHTDMHEDQMVTENLWAKDQVECFRPNQVKQQKVFEVSEVYALDCAYHECGGWKFTKLLKADDKCETQTSDIAVPWNTDNNWTSILDPKGHDATIPDPSGCDQTISNPSECDQTISNPSECDQTISNPSECDQTISNPSEYGQTISNPSECDQTISNPSEYGQTIQDKNGYDATITHPKGYDQTIPDSKGYVVTMPDPKWHERTFKDHAGCDKIFSHPEGYVVTIPDCKGYDKNNPDCKGYDSMFDPTGYDNTIKDTKGIDTTNQDSSGYVVTTPDNKGYVNHDAEFELIITWNSDSSSMYSENVNMENVCSEERLDADGHHFSNDALSFDVCSRDLKPIKVYNFEDVFEKFVSDRNSNKCVEIDECTDTIFVCSYCREWFLTDPDLKDHLLQHWDNPNFSSVGKEDVHSSCSSIGKEHGHSSLSSVGKEDVHSSCSSIGKEHGHSSLSSVDSVLSMIPNGSFDTNGDLIQSSQFNSFEEFWISDSSSQVLTEQSEQPAQENPRETEQVEPVDLRRHFNTVEQNTDCHNQLKVDQITYLDTLDNIKITCHQCSRSFKEDHLFCHDPCFTNKNKDLDDCGICHRKFSSYRSVLTHMRAHSELAKPNKCSMCPRTYMNKAVLDVHCAVHTLENQECHICGKLVNPALLKYHVKLHDRNEGQQRSLQCVVCEQGFQSMASLASHQYSEHDMQDDSVTDIISCYKCPHCKEEMQHKPLFIAHVASHTGVFPFECSQCMEGFFYKTLLNVHSIKYHSVP